MHHFLRHLFRQDKTDLNPSLRLLLIIAAFYMFAFGMFSPIYALFVEGIGGGITVASNAWAVFLLTAGVLTFVFGKIEDRIKKVGLSIAISQFVCAAAYLIYFYADSIALLYVAQMVLGLAAAIFYPAFHSAYGAHVEKSKAAWQWSFYDALAYLIPAMSAVLGGWLVSTHGFPLIFSIMAILSAVCGIFILFLPRELL